ncbi:MAG TPA: hypothetical protein VGC15_14060 [Acetobacteraceae bacterium]
MAEVQTSTSTSPARTIAAIPKRAGRPQPRPPLTIINDPVRALIAVHARQRGVSQSRLSELCGKQHGWLAVYLHKGIPRSLEPAHRAVIAKELQLDEAKLCAPGQAPLTTMPAKGTAQPSGPIADIPLFREGDLIEAAEANEWAPRPSDYPGTGGMFALQLVTGGGRTRPGDMLYVAHRPPRIGDLTVCIRDSRVAAIGELAHMDTRIIRLNTGSTMCDLPIEEHQLRKVTSLVTA